MTMTLPALLSAISTPVTLATATRYARPDLEALTNLVLPSNSQGAIAAEQHRALMTYLLASLLHPDDMVQTWSGAEPDRPISAAAVNTLANTVAAQLAAALASLKAELLGGVGAAYDTLKELADLEITEQGVINTLLTRVSQLETQLSQVAQGMFGLPAAINVGSTGTYPLGTVAGTAGSTSRAFIPTSVLVTLKSSSAGLVTAATLSVGTNAPNYDNICLRSLAGLTVLNESVPLSFHAVNLPAGTAIMCKVATTQVGGAATYDVVVPGIYR